jgi:hypothetical protein
VLGNVLEIKSVGHTNGQPNGCCGINCIAKVSVSPLIKGIAIANMSENIQPDSGSQMQFTNLLSIETVRQIHIVANNESEGWFGSRVENNIPIFSGLLNRRKGSVCRQWIGVNQAAASYPQFIRWRLPRISDLDLNEGEFPHLQIVQFNCLDPHIGAQLTFSGLVSFTNRPIRMPGMEIRSPPQSNGRTGQDSSEDYQQKIESGGRVIKRPLPEGSAGVYLVVFGVVFVNSRSIVTP